MTSSNGNIFRVTGGCFTNASRALQRNLAKICNARNHIYSENFKLKICTCAQSKALGTHTKFQLEILIRSAISAIHKFRENMLESSLNVSETTPWLFVRGIHRSPVNSPYKGQWRGVLMLSLIYAWTNGWINTRDADDLRRHLRSISSLCLVIIHWVSTIDHSGVQSIV